MKPSKEDIESELGIELPDGIEVSEGSEAPSDDSDEGLKFDFIGFIWGKVQVFRKTKFGKLIEIYLYAVGLGVPLPTPIDVSKVIYGHAADYSEIVYKQIVDGFPEDPEFYVIDWPTEQKAIPNEEIIQSGQMPTGTVGIPISGSYLG